METCPLVVKKTVVDGSAEEEFTFQISFWNLSPHTTYAMGDATFSSNDQGMANVSFILKDGEEVDDKKSLQSTASRHYTHRCR